VRHIVAPRKKIVNATRLAGKEIQAERAWMHVCVLKAVPYAKSLIMRSGSVKIAVVSELAS
jgi:hypothetical protein